MNLDDSRVSSALKKNMKSTRGSFFTKGTGREVKPAWGIVSLRISMILIMISPLTASLITTDSKTHRF